MPATPGALTDDEQATIRRRLRPLLEQHPYLHLAFDTRGMLIGMDNTRPNLMGNFAGGDMAYIANAAAGACCMAADCVAETASLNVECLARAEGPLLFGRAEIVKAGARLIRLRVEVFVRADARAHEGADTDKLVAIAQVNMAPFAAETWARLRDVATAAAPTQGS